MANEKLNIVKESEPKPPTTRLERKLAPRMDEHILVISIEILKIISGNTNISQEELAKALHQLDNEWRQLYGISSGLALLWLSKPHAPLQRLMASYIGADFSFVVEEFMHGDMMKIWNLFLHSRYDELNYNVIFE